MEATFAPYLIDLNVAISRSHYVFSYVHPLSEPKCHLSGRPGNMFLREVSYDAILLFGALEGIWPVQADRLVFDPQGHDLFAALNSGAISAKQIAIVANEAEIAAGKLPTTLQNVKAIFDKYPRVAAIVVKRGPLGALVCDRHGREMIPAYEAGKILKIGSGDVFSAIFSFMWAERHETIFSAADFASRAVACYVNDPLLNFNARDVGRTRALVCRKKMAQIYLAAPFFTVADFLALLDAKRAMTELGAAVFSPFHRVGYGDAHMVAGKDLSGLNKSQCVLAPLHNRDPGTIFELGYARAKQIPVIAIGENINPGDLTMLLGTNCSVETDFCTALYKSVWTAFGAV